jgi:hypothetical protein
MFGLIQEILLSDFLIFTVLAGMLLVITSWAFRMGEVPGYLLGWLIGIFFMVIYRSVTGENSQTVAQAAELDSEVTLSLFTVMFSSLIGLIAGFATLYGVRSFGGSHVSRALTVTILTASLIIVLFFLSTSTEETRRTIGIFSLAYCIGALSTLVFSGSLTGMSRNSPAITREPLSLRPPDLNADQIPPAQPEPRSPFDRLRRR